MRQPTDKCLLCNCNNSEKRNSHILPRFISTNFLGKKGGPRKGFSLDADVPVSIGANGEVNSRPKQIQDSPKEDFILCDECEAYFSILETASARFYKDWREKESKGELYIHRPITEVRILSNFELYPPLNRLLVYSFFWRASISSHKLFSSYKLRAELEEGLKTILLSYKSNSKDQLIWNIKAQPVPVLPYCIITSETFTDETANILAGINPTNPASLHVDQYVFFLFEEISDLKNPFFIRSANKYDNDLYIIVVPEELWSNVIVNPTLERAAKQITRMTRGE
jgi:hypothetical protein